MKAFIIISFIVIYIGCNSAGKNESNKNEVKDSVKLDSTACHNNTYKPAFLIKLLESLDSTESRDYLDHGDTNNVCCNESFNYLGRIGKYIITTHEGAWGNNCHPTTRIMIFSIAGKYLGNYYTDGMLPSQVMNNGLYFQGSTVGDFSKSIPDSLIIPNWGIAKFQK